MPSRSRPSAPACSNKKNKKRPQPYAIALASSVVTYLACPGPLPIAVAENPAERQRRFLAFATGGPRRDP
eukprot:15443881-Alexandrium_andersonii.AAC.1